MHFDPLNIPKLTRHVSDFSGILSEAQVKLLSDELSEHEKNSTEQVVVILIPHRQWHELLDIWLKVFNENGIWKKDLNNGLLLIIATEEKKIRIVTGKWMEIAYSEMRCREIIENHLRPLLNKWHYSELIQEFISAIKLSNISKWEIKERYLGINGKTPKKMSDLRWILIYCYLFWFIFPLINDGYIWWFFWLIWWIWSFLVLRNIWKEGKTWWYFYPFSLLLSWLLVIMSVIMLFSPAKCILTNTTYFWKEYSCERNIVGYKYNYTKSVSMTTTSSSSKQSSHKSQSTSSSFWWWGGSSNGGGYGD